MQVILLFNVSELRGRTYQDVYRQPKCYGNSAGSDSKVYILCTAAFAASKGLW
jgi:hypothetical protein